MLDLIGALGGLLKVQSVHIHNPFFCLHYKLTVTCLIAASILIASRQYFGEPIDCEFEEYTKGELNNYCAVRGTYTRGEAAEHGEDEEDTAKNRVRYYTYYSSVFLTLFVQSIVFYTPHHVWEAWEGGKLKALTSNINLPILGVEAIEEGAQRLEEYFSENLNTHNSYVCKYFICELANLINIVGQICFMNQFIGDGYQLYGIYVLFMNRQDMEKRIGELFPLKTICMFEKYGLTGHKEELEGVCLLTHNPLIENIYIFLWFWMHCVAFVTVLVFIYRIITIIFSPVRMCLLRLSCRSKNANEIRAVYEKLKIGDWYLLLLLHGNLNSRVYKELLARLARPADEASV